MNDVKDDYLFDPAARPDPEVERLERALSPFRLGLDAEARPRLLRAHPRPLPPLLLLAGVAATVALALAIALWPSGEGGSSGYRVEALAGLPVIVGGSGGGALAPGQSVVCGERDRARVTVGAIGSVVLEPGARLRVGAPEGDAGYRLELERGRLSASIFAAPRLFQVGTPAGIAVDLGCIYTAEVDDAGRTTLSVVSGRVSFETAARRVLVPAGASTVALPGRPPGTPVWDDAAPELRAAVRAADAGAAGALERVLVLADERDALSLWHLLDVGAHEQRLRVAGRLAELAPPPAAVDLAAVLAGDAAQRERWRRTMDWSRAW